nr:PREDICTED: arsenite methyltransferase [Apteryx mantelli mantelli]
MAAPAGEQIHRAVQDYYGQELQRSEDLKTNACVTLAGPLPRAAREALERVHGEVVARYYGCGLVLPECLASCRVLDLGSGSGRDCYLLSQLVGEEGHVTGIDMTQGQVEVARKHIAYHMDKFGFRAPNVDFIQGYMEKLGDAGLADESYDIVISNCVINLSPDKGAVLREAYRVLKPGGEMYFSDIYASRRLSEAARAHRVLWGECLAGALCWRELYSIAQDVGFSPPRLVAASPITVGHEELESIVGDCRFVSQAKGAEMGGGKGSPTCASCWGEDGRRTSMGKCRVVGATCSATAGVSEGFGPGCIPAFAPRVVTAASGGSPGCLVPSLSLCPQAGEAVDVDADTAAILRSSRFAEDFLIQASGADANADTAPPGCCRGRVKERICDPFQLLEQPGAPGPACCPASACGPRGCC